MAAPFFFLSGREGIAAERWGSCCDEEEASPSLTAGLAAVLAASPSLQRTSHILTMLTGESLQF